MNDLVVPSGLKISSSQNHNGNANADILQMFISGYECVRFTSLGVQE